MKLIKGFSPVLDCHVWTLQQRAHGQLFERTIAILTHDFECYREHVFWQVTNARRSVRAVIATLTPTTTKE